MRKILALVAFVATLLLSTSAALAQGEVSRGNAVLRINDLAIDSSRYTDWMDVGIDRKFGLEIDHTWAASVAVTMTCQGSDSDETADGSGFDIPILEDSATSGTSNSIKHTWSHAVTASAKWTWQVDSYIHRYVNCKFDGTGSPTSSDKVLVKSKGIRP